MLAFPPGENYLGFGRFVTGWAASNFFPISLSILQKRFSRKNLAWQVLFLQLASICAICWGNAFSSLLIEFHNVSRFAWSFIFMALIAFMTTIPWVLMPMAAFKNDPSLVLSTTDSLELSPQAASQPSKGGRYSVFVALRNGPLYFCS